MDPNSSQPQHRPNLGAANGRRIRQACENCRRKKVRCNGTRPACSFCRRLGQHCHYIGSDPDAALATSTQSQDSHGLEALHARIARLESALISSRLDPTILDGLSLEQLLPARSSSISSQESPPTLVAASVQSIPTAATGEGSPCHSSSTLDPRTRTIILDTYFRCCQNQPYSFFHEASLRCKAAEGTIPHHLLDAVVATSIRFLDDPASLGLGGQAAHNLARSSWAVASQLNVDEDGDRGIEIVQSITLLAIFDFVEGKQRGAWVKLGLAARLAQALGLTSEPSTKLSFAEQEEYRRTFWSVYLLDRLVTCGRARPPAFPDSVCSVSLPCLEQAFADNVHERTERLAKYARLGISNPAAPSPFARVVITASVLSKCTQYVIQGADADSPVPPWDAGSEFQKISSDLLYLESQLQFQRPLRDAVDACRSAAPGEHHSVEPLVLSYAIHHVCHCILNHFCLLRNKLKSYSANPPHSFIRQTLLSGQAHATSLTQLLRDAVEMGCAVRSSFLGYCCLTAAIIHSVNWDAGSSNLQQQSLRDIDFSYQFLERNAAKWPSWGTMWRTLQEFQVIAPNYKPFITTLDASIDISDAYIDEMAFITDYGSLSETTRRQDSLIPDGNTGLFTSLDQLFDNPAPYQLDVEMDRFWPQSSI